MLELMAPARGGIVAGCWLYGSLSGTGGFGGKELDKQATAEAFEAIRQEGKRRCRVKVLPGFLLSSACVHAPSSGQ